MQAKCLAGAIHRAALKSKHPEEEDALHPNGSSLCFGHRKLCFRSPRCNQGVRLQHVPVHHLKRPCPPSQVGGCYRTTCAKYQGGGRLQQKAPCLFCKSLPSSPPTGPPLRQKRANGRVALCLAFLFSQTEIQVEIKQEPNTTPTGR